jgi:hypothetical protein
MSGQMLAKIGKKCGEIEVAELDGRLPRAVFRVQLSIDGELRAVEAGFDRKGKCLLQGDM